MFDNKEAVQHAESHSRNRKDVKGSDHLTVIVHKRQPPHRLLAIGAPFQPSQITRDGWFRDSEAELQQFAMDAWRAPARILAFDSADKQADLVVDLRPTGWPGTQAPKQPESGAVPSDNSISFDDDQGTGPTRP